jgi:5-methylcytosine-specific restriction protein A
MVKFWNRDMWQGCCTWHHDTVKQRMERMLATGEATLEDMWLTSDLAKKITISMKFSCATPGDQNL